MRVVIADDEPLARGLLRNMLAAHADVNIVGEFGDGASALDGIRDTCPDLVLLDIQMPEGDGFAVLQALGRARVSEVIFVTAYDEYALRAFEYHALDYLLKPFDEGRLASALQHAAVRVAGTDTRSDPDKLMRLIDGLRTGPFIQRIPVRTGDRIVLVGVGDVEWLEAEGKYIRVHAKGQSWLVRERLSQFELTLDPQSFRRVSRGAIVNLDAIVEVRNAPNGEYLLSLTDGAYVNTTRTYRDVIDDLVGMK